MCTVIMVHSDVKDSWHHEAGGMKQADCCWNREAEPVDSVAPGAENGSSYETGDADVLRAQRRQLWTTDHRR
jgi:hypothetical protein